ncbi:Eco57I restriction-modification methylase domain-containing protein [uncultured Brachyspira sp.]|uniref:type IIG restriction enzyme/methyltransferase n=1 Tax=uncultured Brachyspira sp. TaxID=221953 RepID=UPI002587E79F|nr:Eco57I restriction-modification methylase domain-containing protein [uncultured Brachyspira sp.]
MKSITKEAKELLKRRDLLKSSIFSNLSNTEELNNLSEKLEIYKNGIRKAKEDKESEEHCKNILKDFLNGAFKYNCNTKGKIDLTIKYEGDIKAIIETKNYDNKTEMIKDNDYYYKSFYQSVLYYYQSRKNINKDMTVEHIIITDFENIYLFLRSDFEYLTANKQIINFFNVKKIDTNTKDFYNSSKAILEKINREVVGYKINLFEDDAEIIFKFLSPYNICSLKTNNDFNIISNTFYREIIYMMGLEETKDKKLVLNKVDNTLIKLTMDILDEDLKGEEKFETALKLNILWINRILFLKILEAQLRVFRDDNNLHILNYNEIVDYSFLYTLFFKVLAKSKERRITENKENEYYKHIPYLNSSLFEETEEEKINSITKLNNSLKMKIMSGSVLYKDRDFDKKELNFLEYILRFLNCYIFNAINDSSNINKNTIIKSSILGLVFERLNGYKDGSHFTPPAITMYMAKYSIEKSIVNKFNKFFKDANFKNIDEIKIYVDANIHKIKEQVKYILDSITIIDPACGSGHFLVACLNELIKIKSYLHVLSNDIKVDIEDDELVINYINGAEYKYNMEGGNISEIKQKIQKILFEAKKHIINNQLYGVDINPNSVNICRLRLWIELLKSSYYLENNGADKYIDLEILPNLEFKVLSANSLIELEEKEGNNNLKLAYDKTELVKNMREYFNADFETKKEIRKKVLKLLKEYSQYNTKLKDYNPFDMLKSYDFFDSEIMFGIDSFDIVIMNPPYFQLTGKHKYLHYFEKGKNKTADIYQLFMETALNKLLSQMGVVSAVVSNKWMRAGYGERTREFLYNNCYVFEIIDLGANWFESATVDTNIITYAKDREKQEKIEAYKISKCENIELNKNEKDNFIFTSKDYGAWIILNKTEKDILEKVKKFKPLKDWNINIYRGILTGFNEAFIIDEETKNKLIKEDKKSKEIIKPLLRGRDIKRYSYDFKNLYLICTFPALNLNISDYPAIEKYLKSFGKRLEQSGEIGCRKKTIHKWFEMQDTIAYYKEFDKPKIIYAETTISPNFYYDNENFIAEKTNFIMTGENLKYIMSVLSSKLGFYIFYNFYSEITLGDVGFQYRKSSLEEFPIPEVDKKTEKEIINLVEKVIEGKKKGIDTRELEWEIDKIVYELYNLNENEIKVIEGKD